MTNESNEWYEPFDEDNFNASIEYYESMSIDEEGLKTQNDFSETDEERKKRQLREENSKRTRIKASTILDESEPILKIGDSIVGRRKELIAISGAEGCGKTAFVNAIIAAALSNGNVEDFNGIYVAENPEEFSIQTHDTEQSPLIVRKVVRSNLKRCRIEGDGPEYYEAHSLLDVENIMSGIEERSQTTYENNGGANIIVLDGGAECVSDTNDLLASKEAVLRQKRIAENLNCLVIVVVHCNPGTDKPRGHYGSELLRMAASVLLVKQNDEDISTVTPLKLRHAGKKDFPNIQFAFNQEKGYHTSIGVTKTISKKEEKAIKQEREDDELIKQLFPFGTTLTYDAAIKKIIVLTGVSKSYAPKTFTRINKTGRITETGELYHIKTATV